MKIKYLLFLILPLLSFSQVQIGDDINGENGFVNNTVGASVSVSFDGSVIAIGSKNKSTILANSGSVMVYKNFGGLWTQIGDDINGEAEGDFSGSSVSLSSDGNIVAIGAPSNDGNGNNSGHVRVYENINDVWTQIGNDIDGESQGDLFGENISISSNGSIIAVGAIFNDGNGNNSGHVRIYENINDVWTQIGNDIDGEAEGDQFGESVSLSSNGSIVAIGAQLNDGNGNNSGHVQVYENISGVWTKIGNDIDGENGNDFSGSSVSLSSNGSIIAIGAIFNDGSGNSSGHVRVYENIDGDWTQIGNDIDGELDGDNSGNTVSLSSDGIVVAIGAYFNNGNGDRSGHVRVYENINDVWTQIGNDIDGEAEGDELSTSMGISKDGSVVIIGAPQSISDGPFSGQVKVYGNVSSVWTQIGDDFYGEAGSSADLFGNSISISSDGKIIAIAARNKDGINGLRSGQVKVYENLSGVWTQIGDDIDGGAERDNFGWSISLSSEGNVLAIGAPYNRDNGSRSGQVKIYENINGVWTQIGDNINGEGFIDALGFNISLSSDGSVLAIGVPFNSDNGSRSGQVKIYENINGVWTQIGDNIDGKAAADNFGSSVSLSLNGNIVAIQSHGNEGNRIDVGYISIYKNVNGVWTQVGDNIYGEGEGDEPRRSIVIGNTINISYDGNIVAIGTSRNDGNGIDAGHVRIYENINSVWTQIGDDIDGNEEGDRLGSSLSLSSNGSIVAVGAPGNDNNGINAGQVSVYQNINGVWTKVASDIYGDAEGDRLGNSISLSLLGNVVAVGAQSNDENGIDSGQVRVYDLSVALSSKSFNQDYFSFYPNPVKDILNIDLNQGLELEQVNIYSIQSQYLYSVKILKIDVSNLSSGMYIIEVETNQGKSAKKIVIE